MFTLIKLMIIIGGSMIIAIGIDFFLVPFKILDGGLIGLALITQYLWGLKVGLTIILFSIPIYIFAWFNYRSFFYNSILGMLISSFFIDILYPYQFYFTYFVRVTPLTSAITGGILVGLGIGILLRNETSIGGADMLAQIIANITRINVGVTIFFFDSLVVILGGLLISVETFILSIITIFFVGVLTSITNLRLKEDRKLA